MNNNLTATDKNDLQNETYQEDTSCAPNEPCNVTYPATSHNPTPSETILSHRTETVYRYNHTIPLIKELPDEILHQTIYADKIVEVPQTITILKPVYKKEIRELIREVPKIIERTIDRVVEVPDTKNRYSCFNNASQSYKTLVPFTNGIEASKNVPSESKMCTYNTPPEEYTIGTRPDCYVTIPSQPMMNTFHPTHSLGLPYGSNLLDTPSSAYLPPLYYTCVSNQYVPIHQDCIPVTNMLPECSRASAVLPYYAPTFASVPSYPTLVYPSPQAPMMAMNPYQPCTLINAPTLPHPGCIQQPKHPGSIMPFSSSKQLMNDTNGSKLCKPAKPSVCCFKKPFLQKENLKKRNKDNEFFVLKSNPVNSLLRNSRQPGTTHPKTMAYAYPYTLPGTTIYASPVTAPFPFPM